MVFASCGESSYYQASDYPKFFLDWLPRAFFVPLKHTQAQEFSIQEDLGLVDGNKISATRVRMYE